MAVPGTALHGKVFRYRHGFAIPAYATRAMAGRSKARPGEVWLGAAIQSNVFRRLIVTETLEENEVEQIDEIETTEQEPAPAQIPPPPPADSADYIISHYHEIKEKERSVYSLENEYLELKEEAAGAKKAFEASDKELRNLIARGPDRQRKLPLDDKPAEQRRPKTIQLLVDLDGTTLKAGNKPPFRIDEDGDVSAIWNDGTTDQEVSLVAEDFEVIEWENGDESQPAEVVNDAWRKAPFSELGLTLKQNEMFADIGVTTIGQLEDLRARMANGEFTAQWPKYIGPERVTDIENRLISWLDKNRDKFGEVVTSEAEAPQAAACDQPETESEPEATIPIHKANGKGKKRK